MYYASENQELSLDLGTCKSCPQRASNFFYFLATSIAFASAFPRREMRERVGRKRWTQVLLDGESETP